MYIELLYEYKIGYICIDLVCIYSYVLVSCLKTSKAEI